MAAAHMPELVQYAVSQKTETAAMIRIHTNARSVDASVHVEVNVTKITGSNGGGWWFWSKPSTTTTWTASITATGEGVDISKVEYSTDQTNYKTGTSFTSNSEIKTLYIRVTDSNGNITNWIYENGTTRQL